MIEAADTSVQAIELAQEAAPIPAAAVELEVAAEEPAAHAEEVTAAATQTRGGLRPPAGDRASGNAEQEAAPEAAPEAVIADPIAACGTALVMPAGGELADAIPTADGSLPAAHTKEESPAVVIEAADTSVQAIELAQEAAPTPAAAVELEVAAEEPAAHAEEVTAAATLTTIQAVELAAAPVDSDQSKTTNWMTSGAHIKPHAKTRRDLAAIARSRRSARLGGALPRQSTASLP